MSSKLSSDNFLSANFQIPNGDTVLAAFQGEVSETNLNYLLKWVERITKEHIKTEAMSSDVAKRIFHASVEITQNLFHHACGNQSAFYISKSVKGDVWTLGTSNLIDLNQAPKLKSSFDAVINTSKEELRKIKRETLNNGERSDHGGGGMGLIDLARVSCGNMKYEFLPLDGEKLLFIITVQLHSISC